MAKKVKAETDSDIVKAVVQLTLENIEPGIKLFDSTKNSKEWKVDDGLIEQMRKFEKDSENHAIWKGKLTGNFLYFKYYEDNPAEEKPKKPVKKPKKVKEEKPEEIEVEYDDEEEDVEIEELEEMKEAVDEVNKLDELIETEAESEIDELELIDEAYKEEFNVQTVKRESKKYKNFAKKYRESE